MPLDGVTGSRHLVAARPGAFEHGPGGALWTREDHNKYNLKSLIHGFLNLPDIVIGSWILKVMCTSKN